MEGMTDERGGHLECDRADPRVQRVAQILATNDPLREPHRGAGPWQPPPVRDYHRGIARIILKALDGMNQAADEEDGASWGHESRRDLATRGDSHPGRSRQQHGRVGNDGG